ncbi:MAG: metalloregulator ArsR/SmtB family transcription factor [Candidatus Methylacidiphilales bacterium]|nr:metalloregulator ArsR/SmtB family transcription factor [Candidatus Methylacidiphilales bacterium]
MTASPLKEKQLDRVFAALADTTRRDLLARLRLGDSTVCDLAAPQAMSLPGVSKHLRVLEEAGLLQRRIEGRTHRLRFQPAPLQEAVDWIEKQRRFWEGSLDRLACSLEMPVSPSSPPPPKPKRKKKDP